MEINVNRKRNVVECGDMESAKGVMEFKIYASFDGCERAGAATLRVALIEGVNEEMLSQLDALALSGAANIVEKIMRIVK